MDAPVTTRKPWHWSIAVPLGTLVLMALVFLVQRCSHEELPPLIVNRTSGAELPTIVLAPRARTLAGRVVDKTGLPLKDALVWLTAGDEPHWTYTGLDGRFRLENLARDPWQVLVLARGHEPKRQPLFDTGAEHTITLLDEAAVPIVVPKVERQPLALRVQTAPGARTEGREVVLTPVETPSAISSPVPRRIALDAAGEARIEDLIVGDYHVMVLPEWARGGTWPDLLRDLDSPERRLLHHGADSAREPLVLALRDGAIVGRLADTDDLPIEGALVLVQAAQDPSRVWPPLTTRGGEFLARDLPPGRYVVEARAGAAHEQQTVTLSPGETLRVEFPALSTARVKGP